MTWFRVDDKFHDHPKVRKLRGFKLPALGLWTACGSWSADNLSDGFVPCEIVQRFDPDEGIAKRLVEVRLWEHAEHDGEEGYRFHQWTDHQPTRDVVERRRAEARERMRKLRAGESGSDSVRANGERTSTNTFASTGANDFPDHEPPDDPSDFYEPSNESPQVQESVRSNSERTSRNVRDPRPGPSQSSFGTSIGTRRKRPATTIPEDWNPTARHHTYCSDHGLDITHEAFQFRNHADANDRRQVSWNAAFSQWLGNSFKFAKPKHLHSVPKHIPSDPAAAYTQLLEAADAREAARLIGASWVEDPKPPSDPTPPMEWARARRREFIHAHADRIRAALTERKTG